MNATSLAALEEDTAPEECSVEEPSKKVLLSEAERSELIVSHREIGRKLASKLLRTWRIRLSPEDVESIVDVTLCEAAAKFDPNFGAQFSTFVFHYIRGNLLQTIERSVGAKRIMDAARRSAATVSPVVKAPPISEDEKAPIHLEPELLGMRDIETPEQTMLNKERKNFLHTAMAVLDERERYVIAGLYFKGLTIQSIAKDLGCSRKQVVIIRSHSLNKLRVSASASGLLAVKVEPIQTRPEIARRMRRRRPRNFSQFQYRPYTPLRAVSR